MDAFISDLRRNPKLWTRCKSFGGLKREGCLLFVKIRGRWKLLIRDDHGKVLDRIGVSWLQSVRIERFGSLTRIKADSE